MSVVAAVAFPVFIFLLPLLMFLILVPGYLSADEAWLLRTLFPFLMPFSSVMWFIVAHRLVAHRRFGVSCSGYFHVPDDQTGDLQNRMNRQTSTIHKRRILIVDDDDVLRRWLRNQLEPRGFEVWEESQGDEALSAYERNGPWFFVLSDLYFYRGEKIKNGLGLVHAITVITPAQRMAIHTSERDFQASVPVLIKPYPIARLLRLLREPLQSLALPVG